MEFSAEQLKYLQDNFGMILKGEYCNILPIRDGFVRKEDAVWWHGINGPEQIIWAGDDWENIRRFPEVYSIARPKYKIKYIYD